MALIFYSLVLSALGVFVARDLLQRYRGYRSGRAILAEKESIDKKSLVDSFFRPLFVSYSHLFKNVRLPSLRRNIEKKIVMAALTEKFNPEIFWSFQVLMSVVMVFIYLFLWWYLRVLDFNVQYKAWHVLLALVGGFLYPLVWLRSKVNQRTQNIVRVFPDFVSTLTLSVEAGLDYFAAMLRYVENVSQNPLRQEIQQVIHEVRLGSNREDALKNMAQRINIRPVRSFVAVLVQATNLGTSISQVLKTQASKLRQERFERAERAGQLASQKLLFPLVFFIMPAVFVLIFGPLIVRLVTGGINSLFQ